MSCGPEAVTFRILDEHAGWHLDLTGDAGVAIGPVIELNQLDTGELDAGQLAGVMPPPWIARGCGPCEWYLASRCDPPSVLRYAARVAADAPPTRDPCTPAADSVPGCLGWVAIAGAGCHLRLIRPVAVAAAGHRVAVLDAGRRELLVLSATGDRVIAAIATAAQGPIAFAGDGILVADGPVLWRYDAVTLAGRALVTANTTIERLVVASGVVWIAVDGGAGQHHLQRLAPDGQLRDASLAELAGSVRATGLGFATADAASIEIPCGGAAPRTLCIDRCGRPAVGLQSPPAPLRHTKGGVVATEAIDSGIPRCQWHRVRLELDLPERTSLAIKLATVERKDDPVADLDWQLVDSRDAITDFLIDQPPGRYLRLALELRGDGAATPRLRRVRIDFPRSTSATRLPGVFREDPIAADFLDRFVATFDASIEDLDRVIERFPALLDPATTPAEALRWLGGFLDIALDPAWSEDVRRRVLAEAPELYRRRGTPWALARAVLLTTGIAPAILELGGAATYGRVAAQRGGRGFRLGETRLFGRARARLRLGTSALDGAPLRSYGDPDRDHVAGLGWRITVQLPGGDGRSEPDAIERVRRLVEAQKPAHVVASVRVGGELVRLGIDSAVGIDTRLGGLPPPILGRNLRLRRQSALARSPSRGGAGMAVGTASAVAIQTVLS